MKNIFKFAVQLIESLGGGIGRPVCRQAGALKMKKNVLCICNIEFKT